MSERKTLGLALSCGGSRGVAHVGFLKALEEAGVVPDFVSGASMGAIVGAAYCKGLSADEIYAVLGKLRMRKLAAFTFKRGGFMSTRKMRKLLEKNIGKIRFSDLKIPFRCTATDIISQRTVEFSDGELLDAVIASSSIPTVFVPTVKDGMRLVDGVVLERVPVLSVKNMGADVVVAVDALGVRQVENGKKLPSAVRMILDCIDVMDNARTKRYKEDHKDVIDLWIEPDLGDMSQHSFKGLEIAYEGGYKAGKEAAPKIKELLKK